MMPFKIESLTAWIGVDADGEEGVLGTKIGDSWIPLIAADAKRLELLRPYAETMRVLFPQQKIKLIRFTTRTDVEEI